MYSYVICSAINLTSRNNLGNSFGGHSEQLRQNREFAMVLCYPILMIPSILPYPPSFFFFFCLQRGQRRTLYICRVDKSSWFLGFFCYRDYQIFFHIYSDQLHLLAKKVLLLVTTFQCRTALIVVGFLCLQLALTFSQSFTVLCFSHTVSENTAHTMSKDLLEHISS